MNIKIYYDKECPFCNTYANYIKLQKRYTLILKNARENKKEINDLNKKGFDINNGIILETQEGKILQGSDVLVLIDSLSEKKLYIFDNIIFKKFAYPLVKLTRKVFLYILGKTSVIKHK